LAQAHKNNPGAAIQCFKASLVLRYTFETVLAFAGILTHFSMFIEA